MIPRRKNSMKQQFSAPSPAAGRRRRRNPTTLGGGIPTEIPLFSLSTTAIIPLGWAVQKEKRPHPAENPRRTSVSQMASKIACGEFFRTPPPNYDWGRGLRKGVRDVEPRRRTPGWCFVIAARKMRLVIIGPMLSLNPHNPLIIPHTCAKVRTESEALGQSLESDTDGFAAVFLKVIAFLWLFL